MTKHKRTFLTPWRVVVGAILLAVIIGLGVWLLLAGKNIAVFNPQGVVAAHQRDLIVFTLILSLFVVVPVFVMLGAFAWRYREGNTKAKHRPDEDGNKWLEILWWGIPIIIITILSVVTWVSTHQLDPYKPLASSEKPLKVQVVALQWKWLFLYPEQRIATVNELRIPVGVPVNFELTADAPMSAFWIPNLGTQVYAMNGMSSKLSLQADKEGVYRGSNSNINGEGYADMTFNAVAVPKDAFSAWAKATELASDRDGRHMDWDRYSEVAKPSRKEPVNYYHLHDLNLYNRVMQKYMPSGHGDGGHSSNDSHEGGAH
jgi:cytochrome o ubiquinol oxidase subunit 2